MTFASFVTYSSVVMPTSLSPWCQSSARKPPGPSWWIRRVVLVNRPSPGCHWLTLVPPKPVEAMPIGTLYFAYIASPNAGHGLPPLLLSLVPGCGSSATCQLAPLKLETMPDVCSVLNCPEFVEFDCPAMTNTSPTPTLSTVTV